MILGSPFSITPLKYLQSFLLNLTPGQIFHYPVVNILSIIDIRGQRAIVVDHVIWQVLVSLVVNGFIPFYFIQPTPWQFVIFLFDIFWWWTLVLFYFTHHLAHVWIFYFQYLCLNLIPILPLSLWKYPRLLLKLQLRIQLILRIIVKSLPQKIKLPITTHSRIRHLTSRSRKRYLLSVIIFHMIESFIDPVRWVQV